MPTREHSIDLAIPIDAIIHSYQQITHHQLAQLTEYYMYNNNNHEFKVENDQEASKI